MSPPAPPSDATLARMTRGLEQVVDVETPEQVVVSYTIAGVGSRAAAALIDYALCAAALVGLWVLARLLGWAFGLGSAAADRSGSWVAAVLFLVAFAVAWGYFVFFEALADGQTPGKRRMRLRVVQDGGYSITFAASAVRNLVRILDMQPLFCYGVGIISAVASRSGKRLGDLLAGTIVVQERQAVLQAGAVHRHPSTGAPEAPAVPPAAQLSDAEFALLDRFVARYRALDPTRRGALANQLVARFADRLTADVGQQPLGRLLRLHERERGARARGSAVRDVGAAREQHVIVAQGAERWAAFARTLEEVRRRGLHRMTEAEVSDFVARYRELTGDLARLATAARGGESEALYYLSRLVAAGHNLLYRRQRIPARSAWRYVLADVPREIRRSWRPILLAALLLFGPMGVTYVAVRRNPDLARTLLPAEMIDRAEAGVARARAGRGYIAVRPGDRPVLASYIIANNVTVTYNVFALGLTAGVGTVFQLVLNGVAIGAAVGLYASKGIAHLILTFVVAHGVLELSAICLAGGGAFLIAAAILLPGARTRREALVAQGRRAIALVTGATLFLLVAGTIEGLISPRDDWPALAKVAVALLTAVLMAAYIASGRRGRHSALGRGPAEGGRVHWA